MALDRIPGIEKCCELATDLLATATHGCDDCLLMPLPHTDVLMQGSPK